MEAAVDDVEGVGVDDAEAGVNGHVVEIHSPPAVVEGAGDAFEGDQHVEAGAGGEAAEGNEVFLVTVAVDFSIQFYQTVESGLIGRNAAVQVFALKVDVIGPAVYIVISPGGYGAAVDPGGYIGKVTSPLL